MLNRIKVHWTTLTELITLEGDLIDKLYAKNCITNIQRQLIEAAEVDAKKNSRLLEIMSRKSVADFNFFVEFLQDTQQGHVAAILFYEDAGKFNENKLTLTREMFSVSLLMPMDHTILSMKVGAVCSAIL